MKNQNTEEMDELVFLIAMKELWEKINIVSVVALMGFIGTMVTTLIVYRTDRQRLKNLEIEKNKMRDDFEAHKNDNVKTFKEIRDSIHASNQSVVDKMDELKMYLLHSKITIKGKENENT